jgi:hypothetical protein
MTGARDFIASLAGLVKATLRRNKKKPWTLPLGKRQKGEGRQKHLQSGSLEREEDRPERRFNRIRRRRR